MNIMFLILTIIGAAFFLIGLVMCIIFGVITFMTAGLMGPFILIPAFLVLLGVAFLFFGIRGLYMNKYLVKHGKKYAAKIYSYVENRSYTVNGSFLTNIKVHFWDEHHQEKEAVIPTNFAKGSGEYPIGMTIDIYEYNGKYGFDPKSVRDEILMDEQELMDDKPIDRGEIRMRAVTCPTCSASFQAIAGYSAKCPYCGGYIDA